MSLRIATFNANNLFERPALFQLPGVSAQANQVLKDIEKLQELLAETSYAGSIGTQIVAILEKYNFHTSPKNPFFTINEMRGKKLIRVKTSPKRIELVAKGRDDWFGTIDLIREVVPAASTDNTGRVIQAVRANILCLVEIESRLTLKQFSDTVLKKLKSSFPHNMLIDGNDPRGIDIGLYSQFEIASIRSHIDDSIGQTSRIFSRDCPEYEVKLPSGRSLWMLCNHFKSKGGPGPQATKDARRKRQADRVAEILTRFDLTKDLVVVTGDFNDTPTSGPLAGLLATPNLFDVLASPLHTGSRGTFLKSNDQIDFLLVSKPLNNKLKAVGIERRGIFGPGCFPEVTSAALQASDHASVFAEFDIG